MPTGPMVRMLRRIAKGKQVVVKQTDPTIRGYALILTGLVDRALIEPGGASGIDRVYRLTSAGQSAIDRTRSSLR